MIIGQITNEELNRRDDPKQEKLLAYIPPGVRAVQLLQAWLTTVNEAGLEGKRLKNFRVHGTHDLDFDNTLYQLHADVEHRLRTPPTAVEAENANLRYALGNMLKRWKALEAAQTDGLGFRFPDARDREAMMNAEHVLSDVSDVPPAQRPT